MKIYIPVLCTLLLLLFARQISFAQSPNDTITITNVANGVTKYFFNQDMTSFANLRDDSAVFINVGGLMTKGKKDIIDMHKAGKYMIDSSTVTELELPVINFVSKYYAIVYSV